MDDAQTNPSGFSRWKRWAMGLQVVVSVAALLAIVVMANYLSSRHYERLRWTPDARHDLSPLTRQLLAGLTNEIKITVLFDPDESTLFTEVRALLAEYAAASPRLEIEYVNYGRNKGRAEFLLSHYRVSSAPDTLMVIFDAAGRPPRVVRERELSDYDFSAALQGAPIRRVGFKGEQFFTSALLWATDPRPLRAYALTGHGEADPANEDAPEGFARFTALLNEKNVQLQPLTLRTNGVPEDCELLVIAAPRHPVSLDERTKIDRYLRSGGRALVLLLSPSRPGGRRSGLEELLLEWGVEVVDGLVVDRSQSQAGDTRVLLTGQFSDHPTVRPLRGSRLGLIMPTAVFPRPATGPGAGADGAKVEPLAFTSPEGMVVSPLGGDRARVETNGVIPLAVAVERGAIAGVIPDRGAARLVVVGEATFLGNQLIDFEANRDFAGLAVNWLLDRRQLLALSPRPIREYQINLTRTQLHGAAWILLGVLPGGTLLLGLMVWLRRRR
jgi:hypothetical protein